MLDCTRVLTYYLTGFVMGIIGAAFIAGIIIGAYGHKWIVSKAAAVGVTVPPKLP